MLSVIRHCVYDAKMDGSHRTLGLWERISVVLNRVSEGQDMGTYPVNSSELSDS